jgi:Flp pilus assembly protein TadG
MPPARRGLASDARGATLIEFALLLPLFIALVVGIMQVGHVLWIQTALQHAVEMAARCASVNATSCGTVAQVQAYAATQAYGVILPVDTFTASAAPCGNQVVASYDFAFQMGLFASPSVNLSARSCYPL